MFYESVDSNKVREWLSWLQKNSNQWGRNFLSESQKGHEDKLYDTDKSRIIFVFSSPIDVQDDEDDYPYRAYELEVSVWWYKGGDFVLEWFNAHGDKEYSEIHDYESTVDLIQTEVDLGLGADVELQGIDTVME